MLILPILAAGAVVNELMFTPKALYAAEAASPSVDSASATDEATQRAALRKRSNWLDRAVAATKPTASVKASRKRVRPAKPLKVIHTRATWYGPGFHGRRTASGERFNRHAMTLASRHLPFGTRVRVVNPKTGKAVVARVNDRGPFRGGYTADLSQAVARKIGLGGSGPVRLEILPKSSKTK
ncbi:MAG: septal ring lytic transglycosylase RlpA family protein [Actinomycetota bacterium]